MSVCKSKSKSKSKSRNISRNMSMNENSAIEIENPNNTNKILSSSSLIKIALPISNNTSNVLKCEDLPSSDPEYNHNLAISSKTRQKKYSRDYKEKNKEKNEIHIIDNSLTTIL